MADAVRDRYIERVVLEKGLLSEAEIERARSIQKERLQGGEDLRLDNVFLENGFLSRDDVVLVRIGAKEKYFARLYKKVKDKETRKVGKEGAVDAQLDPLPSGQRSTGGQEESRTGSGPIRSDTERRIRPPTGRHRRLTTRKVRSLPRRRRSRIPVVAGIGLFLVGVFGLVFVLSLRDPESSNPESTGEGSREESGRVERRESLVEQPASRLGSTGPDRALSEGGQPKSPLYGRDPEKSFEKEVGEGPPSGPPESGHTAGRPTPRSPLEEEKERVEVPGQKILRGGAGATRLVREAQELLRRGDEAGAARKIQELKQKYPEDPLTRYLEDGTR